MRLRRFLQTLRHWSWVVVTGAAIGFLVGWISAPGRATPSAFEATHTMLLDAGAPDATVINRAAVLATLGAVPDRVSARLGLDRDQVRSMVSAVTRDDVGQLLVTGRSPERSQAQALANVTAEELILEFGGSAAPFRTFEPAVAAAVERDAIEAPPTRAGRAVVLCAFGLALGICAAVALDRFDSRIQSKSAAEGAIGAPVLAEVPAVPRSERDRLLLPADRPPVVEAYRALRTMVDRWAAQNGSGDHGRIIVVTSPTGGEGKTATVAHLAVTLAEVGRSVLVISADLRRPRLHRYFDRPGEPGLADVLGGAPDTRRLTDLNLVTGFPGIALVPSGAPVGNPSPLLERIGEHLDAARSWSDVVLVDSPPVLTAGEGADLARRADGVLLVVRARRTSIGAAVRSAELFERLAVPVIGAVLIGGGDHRQRTRRS